MRRLTIMVFFFMVMFPSAGHALTLEVGLLIVAATGRDVKFARSD